MSNSKKDAVASDTKRIVSGKFTRDIQDDFVFVYKKGGKYKAFGLGDATKYHEELINEGYDHADTISASMWIEGLLNARMDKPKELAGKFYH